MLDGYYAQDQRRLNHGEIETGAMEVVLRGRVFGAIRIADVKNL